MTLPKIGWIGVGNLGAPICGNLLKSGAEICVCDIDPARTESLARDGAAVASDPAAVARQCEVVFSTLPTDAALRAVAAGENGLEGSLAPGQIYVDMSTVSPGTSADVAGSLASTGALFLRATVSGSTANAAAGTLAIFCSGPEDAYDRCRPILETIGSRHSYNGPGEEARVLKLLVNLIVIATPVLVGEALAFGRKSGLGWDAMIDAIAGSVGASPVFQYKADMLKRRDWTAMATVDLAAKDLSLALEWGRDNGVPMPVSALVQQFSSAFQASGDGGRDFFYTATWPERLMGEAAPDSSQDSQ